MGINTFDGSAAFEQAKNIFSQPGRMPQISLSGVIHTPDRDIPFTSILKYRQTSDFENEHATKHRLLVNVGKGDYLNHISPNRDNCLVTLTIEVNGKPLTLSRYRAGVYDKSDFAAQGGDGGEGNAEQVNQEGFRTFSLQIANPYFEKLRDSTIANTPLTTDMETLLQVFHAPQRWSQWNTPPSPTLPTKDEVWLNQYEGEVGVDVVPPNDNSVIPAYLLPKGITLPRLVPFLQKEYGIYMEGAGRFHFEGIWYIYPLYNLTRFEKEEQVLTVVNAPTARLPKVERSYRTKDKNVYVLANDIVKIIDRRWEDAARKGNGVRYWNAARVMDDFAWRTGGELFFDLSDNLVSRTVKERKDDLNKYLKEGRSANANHCHAFSRIAPLQGKIIQIRWQDSDPNLIYPGMPVAYIFAEGDGYRKYTGTVLGCVTEFKKVNADNPRDDKFVRESTLTLFAGDKDELQ